MLQRAGAAHSHARELFNNPKRRRQKLINRAKLLILRKTYEIIGER